MKWSTEIILTPTLTTHPYSLTHLQNPPVSHLLQQPDDTAQ